MGLTQKEILSIVQLIIFTPCAILSFIQVIRHHFHRGLSWIFLFAFCTIRIVGAVLFIKTESQENPSLKSVRTALIIQNVGLSPLTFTIAGFLGVIERNSRLPHSRLRIVIHILTHQLVAAGLALSIVGGLDLSDFSTIQEGIKLRKGGAIIFLVIFVILALGHAYCWLNQEKICPNRRRLLIASTAILPFYFIRILEFVISAFTSLLGKFSPIDPSVAVYASMDVVMEFIIVLVYVIAGTLLPLELNWNAEDQDSQYATKERDADGQIFENEAVMT